MIAVGIAQRAKVNESICGDVVEVITRTSGTLVAIADGLGHGERAYEAARLFCDYAKGHADDQLETIISNASKVLSGTRGAAAALVDINVECRSLEFVGVGNIEMRGISKEKICPVSVAGIVGTPLRRVRSFRYEIHDKDLFALFSDGVSSRLALERYRHLPEKAAAEQIVADVGKSYDDVTCVIVRVTL